MPAQLITAAKKTLKRSSFVLFFSVTRFSFQNFKTWMFLFLELWSFVRMVTGQKKVKKGSSRLFLGQYDTNEKKLRNNGNFTNSWNKSFRFSSFVFVKITADENFPARIRLGCGCGCSYGTEMTPWVWTHLCRRRNGPKGSFRCPRPKLWHCSVWLSEIHSFSYLYHHITLHCNIINFKLDMWTGL